MDQDYQGAPVPPPELVQQWWEEADQHVDRDDPKTYFDYIATQAARWGSDQELEACCEWLGREVGSGWGLGAQLRAARRPKPPSLKEQALADFDGLMSELDGAGNYSNCAERIRRALEQLDD